MNNQAPHTNIRSEADPLSLAVRLKKLYISRPEDKTLGVLIDMMVAETELGPEAAAVIITAPSGAGKSRSVARLLEKHPAFGQTPQSDNRLLKIQVPAPCNLATLASRICEALDYPFRPPVNASNAWSVARRIIHEHRIRYIWMDEVQNVTEIANEIEAKKIRNLFRMLLLDDAGPVGLILSGQPSIGQFLRVDPQIKRRSSFMSISPLSKASEPMLDATVRKMADVMKIDVRTDVLEALIPRLAHASLYQFGTACVMIRKALQLALSDHDVDSNFDSDPIRYEVTKPNLTLEHFATLYALLNGSAAIANPFISEDWAALDCSDVLITTDKDLLDRAEKAPITPTRKRGRGR